MLCIMGRFSNGELAATCSRFRVRCRGSSSPLRGVPEERDQLVGRAQVRSQHCEINFDWHCSLPSDNVAKVRCRLARSCARIFDAEKQVSNRLVPVRDRQLVIERRKAQDRLVMERKIAAFHRK